MIQAGKYKARGVAGQLAVAKTGTEMVQVIVRISEGEYVGEELRWDGFLTEKTDQRTLESLRHLGWKGDMLNELDGITENEVQIVVEHEVNEETGKSYPRVQWINKLGGARLKEESKMSESAAKALAQRFASKARGVAKSAAPARAPAAAQGNGPVVADEDVPF